VTCVVETPNRWFFNQISVLMQVAADEFLQYVVIRYCNASSASHLDDLLAYRRVLTNITKAGSSGSDRARGRSDMRLGASGEHASFYYHAACVDSLIPKSATLTPSTYEPSRRHRKAGKDHGVECMKNDTHWPRMMVYIALFPRQ
jgi:hypothetical protein